MHNASASREEAVGGNIRRTRYSGKLKAVILDWAGTAVDYGCMGPASVFIDVFKKIGIDVTLSEVRQFMGLTKKEHALRLFQLPGIIGQWENKFKQKPNKEDVNLFYKDLEPAMVRAVSNYSDPIPGVLDFVQKLRSTGMKIGSSTGYSRPMMDALVPEAKKKGYVPDCVVCASDVSAGRPFPFMCYKNAIDLEIYPLEAMLKIGDTVSDIQEGLNAGMWTAGVVQTGNEMGLTEKEISRLSKIHRDHLISDIQTKFKAAGAHYVVDGIWDSYRVVEDINHRLARGEHPGAAAWLHDHLPDERVTETQKKRHDRHE